MSIRLNELVPDFTAETDQGESDFTTGLAMVGLLCFRIPKILPVFAPPS